MRLLIGLGVCLLAVISAPGQSPPTDFKFAFGSDIPAGFTPIPAGTFYSKDRGWGFEPSTTIPAPGTGAATPTSPPVAGGTFLFSVRVPEGNYRVTVVLGDSAQPSTTTVKSESRVLMLEAIHTDPGEYLTRSFAVNVHGPMISTGGEVKLDGREIGVFHWDDKLTLEFLGVHPSLKSLEFHKIDDAVTVFLCSDSTVTTQVRQPYGTWGQMLPRWFNDHVAVADYAESGETLKAFRAERRWDKVMSVIKPGDYVFLQFGHNDLNKKGHNAIWPANDPAGDWSKTYSEANGDYQRLLEQYAAEVKARGATPVIVSPMTKIDMRSGQLNIAGLGDYPAAAVAAAKEANAVCIDLNATSIEVAKALGPELDRRAYVDGLHTTSYGGYLLSRCMVDGIKAAKLPLAKYLVDDAGEFDPNHPLPPPDEFKVPLEPGGRSGRATRGRAN